MRACACLLCVTVLAGCARVGGGPPGKASREQLQWNHAELFAHLRGKGLVFREGQRGTDGGRPFVCVWFDDNPTVRVSIEQDAQAAKDGAGVAGQGAACWGRFLFVGPEADVAKIQAALGP